MSRPSRALRLSQSVLHMLELSVELLKLSVGSETPSVKLGPQ